MDPGPDPRDPYVFRPPGSGSGSISMMYGAGWKNLNSYCFVTFLWLLSLKNDVNAASNRGGNKQKSWEKKLFSIVISKVTDENTWIRGQIRRRIRSRIRIHYSEVRIRGSESGSVSNVTDQQHCIMIFKICISHVRRARPNVRSLKRLFLLFRQIPSLLLDSFFLYIFLAGHIFFMSSILYFL